MDGELVMGGTAAMLDTALYCGRIAGPQHVSAATGRPKRSFWFRARHFANWLYLLPALFFFLLYMAYPIVKAVWISFTDYQFLNTEPATR